MNKLFFLFNFFLAGCRIFFFLVLALLVGLIEKLVKSLFEEHSTNSGLMALPAFVSKLASTMMYNGLIL